MEAAKQHLPSAPQGIDDILVEAELSFVAGTMEYEIGVRHGYAMAKEASLREAFDKMYPPAETFLFALKKHLPSITVHQVRIGLDYSCGKPVALFVLGPEAKDRHDEIMEFAREIELAFWEKLKTDTNIWTLIDEEIDQDAIERDFPLSRPKVA
jgi:hypothetical protein